MTCQSGDTTHLGLPGQCDFPAGAGLAARAEGRLPALSPALCPVGNRPPRANLFGSGPLCGSGGVLSPCFAGFSCVGLRLSSGRLLSHSLRAVRVRGHLYLYFFKV